MEIIIAIALFALIMLSLLYALERAFESYSKLRYELDKKQEKRYALVMENLLEKEYQLRGSLQIAVNLFLIVFGVTCALIFNDIFIGIVVAVLSVLVSARLIPSLVATINSTLILQYFIYLAKGVTAFFSPFLGREPERAPRTTDKEENNDVVILQNALNFSEVKVKECMIPRTEICAVSEDSSKEQVLDQFADSKYSRILVYRENIDKITGYVHSKDLFTGDKKLKALIREIDFVSEETDAQSLLAMLIKNKRSIAVVNDEYGGTAGIVTLEDLIEEIFGEISDELDREELPEKKISDSEYIFSGRLEIKYLNRGSTTLIYQRAKITRHLGDSLRGSMKTYRRRENCSAMVTLSSPYSKLHQTG